MPKDTSLKKSDSAPYWLEHPPFFLMPICHYRVEFAELVRSAFHILKPDAIALELPASLQETYIEAIERLPEISVIMHHPDEQKAPFYLLIEPADPFTEAARLALKNNIPLSLIDLEVEEFTELFEGVPDTYALMTLGHRKYYETFEAAKSEQIATDIDLRRERAMAYNL